MKKSDAEDTEGVMGFEPAEHIGIEYQFGRCDYRRYVDFTSDGSHHGYRIGLRYQ